MITDQTKIDGLASALGIALDEDNAKTELEKKRAIALKQTDGDKANTDANYAREVIYETIQKANESIDQLMEIARESMSARHYEVLAALLVNNANIAEKLLKIHADKQKVQNNAINLERNLLNAPGTQQALPGNTIVNIDKAVFTGTTTELLDMIRKVNPTRLQDQSAEDTE
jgi:hypothetical protein